MQGQKRAVNAENNQHIGVSCGGKTAKIHAVVDGLGNPVHFMLSDGQVHDSKVAVELLSGVNITVSNIIGNKAELLRPATISQSRTLSAQYRRKKTI